MQETFKWKGPFDLFSSSADAVFISINDVYLSINYLSYLQSFKGLEDSDADFEEVFQEVVKRLRHKFRYKRNLSYATHPKHCYYHLMLATYETSRFLLRSRVNPTIPPRKTMSSQYILAHHMTSRSRNPNLWSLCSRDTARVSILKNWAWVSQVSQVRHLFSVGIVSILSDPCTLQIYCDLVCDSAFKKLTQNFSTFKLQLRWITLILPT